MSIELNALPYEENALEPAISRETVNVHYNKHHAGYVKKVNKAISGSDMDKLSLDEIIARAHGTDQGLYNVAAQVWNHDFYWASMTPEKTDLSGDMASLIERCFGSTAEFQESFKEVALGQFGSGWTWLGWHLKDECLSIMSTTDAFIPDFELFRPVLTLDVWEHAYYLDYKNDRAAYIEQFLDRLVNWESASHRLTDVLEKEYGRADLKRAAR
ncbi:MAG: superoxide dismutase [Pseudomonadales bacterium]